MVRVETTASVLTSRATVGDVLAIPINHFEGNYTCSSETLAELRSDDRVVLRYMENPNGAIDNIAGICNGDRNVVGLMPHPERATVDILGSVDGIPLIRSFLGAARRQHAA
jgi:phosphoribosylformylglycinamidine synthase